MNSCVESLMLPTPTPQVINLKYEDQGSDVQIYPDSSNKTWEEYLQSNSQCKFDSCKLFVGGTCTSGGMTTYNDHIYTVGDQWKVFAKISINTGYQLNVCIACSLTSSFNPPSVYWDNWQVNLIAYECQIQPFSSDVIFLDIN